MRKLLLMWEVKLYLTETGSFTLQYFCIILLVRDIAGAGCRSEVGVPGHADTPPQT